MKAARATIYVRRSSNKWIAFVAIVFVLAVATLQLNLFQGYYYKENRSLLDTTIFRDCNNDYAPPQRIFLDVGANRGDTLRIFYNRGQQPHDSNNRQWKFGIPDYNPMEWRVEAFEASPRMADALHQLEVQYSNLRVHVPVAVWTSDGQHIPLGIDDTTEEQKGWLAGNLHGEWGSSVFHNATETVVEVPTLNLARFLRDTVSCPHHDQVYLKMNVEGAEFPVVKHLMADGTLCLLNHVDMYWHSHLMPEHERMVWKTRFIPMVRDYIHHVCNNTQIHIWGVH